MTTDFDQHLEDAGREFLAEMEEALAPVLKAPTFEFHSMEHEDTATVMLFEGSDGRTYSVTVYTNDCSPALAAVS